MASDWIPQILLGNLPGEIEAKTHLGGGLQGLHGPYRVTRIAGAFCVLRAACTDPGPILVIELELELEPLRKLYWPGRDLRPLP